VTRRRWAVGGFVWTVVVGSGLHFTYALSGDAWPVGLVSAVNESTWEHLKLLFVPTVTWVAFSGRGGQGRATEVRVAHIIALLAGLLLIVVGFYSYRSFLADQLVLDILLFVFAAACAHFAPLLIAPRLCPGPVLLRVAWLVLIAMAVAFAVATVVPPHLPVFQDPRTGQYGFGAAQH